MEEIEDHSKADGFSNTITFGQTLWFVCAVSCEKSSVSQHHSCRVAYSLSLAVLNGLIYFLWWNKTLDVRYPIHVYLLDKSNQLSEHNLPREHNLPSDPYNPREDDEPDVDYFGEFGIYRALDN